MSVDPGVLSALRIDAQSCFSDAKGRPKARLERRARKLLRKTAPLLSQVLEEGEAIRFVAPATTPFSILEFLTTGWIIQVVKRCLLVVTDRRILHLPTKSDFTPRGSVSQIRFVDLRQVKVASFLSRKLSLSYRNGKKEDFGSLTGLAAKKLSALLPSQTGQGAATAAAGRHFICPRCTGALRTGAERCQECGLVFRDRKRALRYSLLFPGGGYFYTGHVLLGIVDALVEGFLLLSLIGGVFLAFEGDPEAPALLGLFGLVLGLEKVITVFHAQHYVAEFRPKKLAEVYRKGRFGPRVGAVRAEESLEPAAESSFSTALPGAMKPS